MWDKHPVMETEKYPPERILLLNAGPPYKLCSVVAGGQVGFLPLSHFPGNPFFITKLGTESYSVNRYNCHLGGEIRVRVAIETPEITYSSNSLVNGERKVLAERELGALELGL